MAVDEPSEENAILMLRGLRPVFEKAHNITIRDEAIVAAVKLSNRFISGRLLPDKAVDLLDTATARVKINLDAKPEDLVNLDVTLAASLREKEALDRDVASGFKVDQEHYEKLLTTIDRTKTSIDELTAKWNAERDAVKIVREARAKVQALKADDKSDEAQAARKALTDSIEAYDKVKSKPALVSADVDPDTVARIIENWTGIPVSKMQKDDVANLLSLEDKLRERVRGQDHAMKIVAETIRASQAGVSNPNQPVGVLLFVGPSGVGKTETAIALAEAMYGGERFMTTINMSEFQEQAALSRLIGASAGYVGYGEGGVLTEAVRQRPYSVVLLDECEKADVNIMNLFYQVFDKGSCADGEGRQINFRNTIIILTSNLATDAIVKALRPRRRAPRRRGRGADPPGALEALQARAPRAHDHHPVRAHPADDHARDHRDAPQGPRQAPLHQPQASRRTSPPSSSTRSRAAAPRPRPARATSSTSSAAR